MMTSRNGSPNTSASLRSGGVLFAREFLLSHLTPPLHLIMVQIIACVQFSRYDIPVLHINDIYWTKHRLSIEDAIAGISEACAGDFSARRGEPDASRLEHKH